MESQIMKGSIDIIILLIISKKDTYGYEISRIIKEKSSNFYEIGEGTLYSALKRLEKKELINSYWKDEGVLNKRKYYTMTESGTNDLNIRLDRWTVITQFIELFKEE